MWVIIASPRLPLCVRSFEDVDGYVGAGAGGAVDEPSPRVLDLDVGPVDPFFRVAAVLGYRPLELPEGEDALHDAGGAHRVRAGQEPARGVHRHLPIDARVALIDEKTALPIEGEAHVLIRLQLAGGVSVVHLREVQLLDGVSDAGLLVGLTRRLAASPEGAQARPAAPDVVVLPGVLPRPRDDVPARAVAP